MTNSRWRNGPRGPYNPYGSDFAGDLRFAIVAAVILAAAVNLLAYWIG